MIYAEFNANNTEYQNIIPGCQLFAAWPHSYGDIYFGEDNCLYDSSGNSIDGQCCTAATTASVANPYFQYPAWDTTGPAGFHIVEYIEYMYGNPPEDHVWLGVVGSANINCTTIVNNQNKYTAYGSLGNGFLRPGQLAGDYPMPPDYVNSSTTQFYLFGAKDPLCGVTSPSNFTLGFNSTWTTNGPGSFGRKLETSYSIDFSFRLDVVKKMASANRFTQAFGIHQGPQAHALFIISPKNQLVKILRGIDIRWSI
jgi:hypothetical protein